ncbi:EcsC family protein [Alkalihalobacterium bogoriense]|uniref:EcsC family protein n=1 Tax=Alkalihalobacterium bogoriense TaxID=246272 RepID=UPI00047EBEE2|nr:EcsC family protein [Alkalihalobacterium bogoriense]
MLTEREEKLFLEIQEWEEMYFKYETSDIKYTYQKWLKTGMDQLGTKRQQKMLATIDSFLFHLQAMIQHSQYQEEANQRLITQAKVFNPSIETIEDIQSLSLEQMNYIAEQQMAKQRLVSFGQGGVSGFGGIILLGLDVPAMLIINMRAIQLIALSYGYNVKKPFEMIAALKLFHMATLPKEMQARAWDELWAEMGNGSTDELFYEGNEEITDISWIQQPVSQVVKASVIMLLRKKLIQGIPLFGMAVGATVNYSFSRKITEVAQKFYQKRQLLERDRKKQ